MEGAGPGVLAGASLPVSHSPRPGQHVDVSAELSCILGHLLWRGIVPRILWLHRGSQGTQGWLQQQSHARGQKEQEEAAVRGCDAFPNEETEAQSGSIIGPRSPGYRE